MSPHDAWARYPDEGPVFEPVRDPAFFERFFIEAGTIVWPNGADIAPETRYERAKSSDAA